VNTPITGNITLTAKWEAKKGGGKVCGTGIDTTSTGLIAGGAVIAFLGAALVAAKKLAKKAEEK